MAMDITCIINTGSASKKYALYRAGELLLQAHVEHEADGYTCTIESRTGKITSRVSENDYTHALQYVLAHAGAREEGLNKADIIGAGVRIVAPGTFFQEHHAIDTDYRERLRHAATIAPLHIDAVLAELEHVAQALPGVPLFGISDSAFHRDMSMRARSYAISGKDATTFDVFRFGYHGLSVASVALALMERGALGRRAIVCHLGSGGSLTALFEGKSIDTSMGFTPDEGIPMATRVGTIDAGAVLYLEQQLGGRQQAVDYFNHKSGLLGVSGSSNDIRLLLQKENEGDTRAKAALDLYVYQIQKHIGAYVAVLGGIDTLVFTGTVGERSAPIRGRVCAGLRCFGIELDQRKNEDCYEEDVMVQTMTSPVAIAVVRSREMEEMAHIVAGAVS